MSNCQSKKTLQWRYTAVLGLGLLSMQSMSAAADDLNESQKITHIRGITVTGVNQVRGRPIFDWGGVFGTFNFPSLFVYNPNGAQPLDIDENTPESAIVATGVSPLYLLTRGEGPEVVDPAKINLPLRKVPINVDFKYIEKVQLPGLEAADPLELAQSEPANDITLGQWLKASGEVKLDCTGERATVRLQLKHLVPNRIYSAWFTAELPPEIEGKPGRFSSTIPIGGTPNIFMTDADGNATYERRIKFCPFDTQAADLRMPKIPMLNIEVLYHADQEAYGAIPAPGLMLGLITFSHVLFPINVTMLTN